MFLDGTATKLILTFVFFVVVKKEPWMDADKERFDIRVDPRPSVVLKCTAWDLRRHLLSQSQM